jgi:hypothetical protein
MRADWKVGSVFIEYAGLMDEPEYSAKMEMKRDLASATGLPLVVIAVEDVLNLEKKLGWLMKPQSLK